jgi:hypothetical protein
MIKIATRDVHVSLTEELYEALRSNQPATPLVQEAVADWPQQRKRGVDHRLGHQME